MMSISELGENLLGAYLKDRRARVNPASLGLTETRRRTPGLRREEVAQRANISPTWYTWLEQGRGGAPSSHVLERIARALMLSDAEREHIFLLGLGRLPDVSYKASEPVTPKLQRVLDAFQFSPAFIKTATWDVVAWNRAATLVLTDYEAVPAEHRNILRLLFCDPGVRRAQHDWDAVARFVVATFRADVARAGATAQVKAFVTELCQLSAQFAAMWSDNAVSNHGEGVKHLHHPIAGSMAFEYSAFAVDGQPDLGMVVYNPVSAEDAVRIQTLVESQRANA